MIKYLFLLLLSTQAYSQEFYTANDVRVLQKIQINVVDGLVYKWTATNQKDSVRYFNISEGKKYRATVTFQEILETSKITVQAESPISIVNAQTSTTNPAHLCCILPGAVIAYKADFGLTPKTKVTIRYARGNAGISQITMRDTPTGPAIKVFDLNSTTSWGSYVEASFTIPGQSSIKTFYLTATVNGAADIDYLIFE